SSDDEAPAPRQPRARNWRRPTPAAVRARTLSASRSRASTQSLTWGVRADASQAPGATRVRAHAPDDRDGSESSTRALPPTSQYETNRDSRTRSVPSRTTNWQQRVVVAPRTRDTDVESRALAPYARHAGDA
ncbi:hypothetical protein PFISCL1PPCAC_18684, partial [Pristionchus fissidentatus]